MDANVGPGENMSNYPHDMDELAKELDSMSVEDLREEFDILLSEMDENSSCGELLDLYMDAIARKDPQPQGMDTQTTYEHDLKRMNAKGKKRRSSRTLVKVCFVAAVIAALLAASVALAYARGFDLFDRIAQWTTETFGLTSAGASGKNSAEIPPQLQEMKDAMGEYGVDATHLPTYWLEGYEQTKVTTSMDPESIIISGAFEKNGNYIVLSYIQFLSEIPKDSYNIDDQSLEVYEHNGIKFHIMTNAKKYLVVWTSNNVECRLSGLGSYEDLIKILDSIGG